MTEEQRPARAYQPWSDQEYEILGGSHAGGVSVDTLAKGLSRYPSEVENALIRLKFLNEAMTNRNEAVEHRQAIKSFPEHLIDHYGSGLRPLNAVLKPKTSTLTKEDLAEIENRFCANLIRRSSRLIINGRNYNLLLMKARKRVHLQIEISATLAGGK